MTIGLARRALAAELAAYGTGFTLQALDGDEHRAGQYVAFSPNISAGGTSGSLNREIRQ